MPKKNVACQLWDKGKKLKLAIEHLFDEDDEVPELEADAESEFAVLRVKVYQADGLPNLQRGIMQYIKKYCPIEDPQTTVSIDPYVQVFFAGLKGSTSKQKQTTCPVWNEEVVFTTKFPIPPQSIVVRVRDDQFVTKDIGMTVIPIQKISSSDEMGFLPTFGPCYVSLRDCKHSESDDVSYNGRLLMAITTDIIEASIKTKTSVDVQPSSALSEGAFVDAEFFLFASIQNASMIDRRMTDTQDVRFSLQMGEEGREMVDAALNHHNATSFMPTMPMDRQYVYLPIECSKPCMWLKCKWPDENIRMFFSNIMSEIERQLEHCIDQFQKHTNSDFSKDELLNDSLKDLKYTTKHCLKVLKEKCDIDPFRTQLDKERSRVCERYLEEVLQLSAAAKTALNKKMRERTIDQLKQLLSRIETLTDNPQSREPNVILWLEKDSKRMGYVRLRARELLYAVGEYEQGELCGKTTSLFLKPFGKSGEDSFAAIVECYMWLGRLDQMQYCFRDLPHGFNADYGLEAIDETEPVPRTLHYFEKQSFRLRAHIYCARSLRSRYPNCYAKIFFKKQVRSTQICQNSLNPIWDEMLVFPEIEFCGDVRHNPVIIVEVHNHGRMGKSGFLGRVSTSVKVKKNSNDIACLQWYDIPGESESSAQLLATFELYPLEQSETENLPRGGGDADDITVLPIPLEIRPRFSIHRIEILLWGLRQLRRSHWRHIDQPCIEVECVGQLLHSSVIFNYRQHSNFSKMIAHTDLDLPEQNDFLPALIIKLIDKKSFGRKKVIATHVLTHLQEYVFRPTTSSANSFSRVSHIMLNIENVEPEEEFSISYLIDTVEFPWTRQERRDVEGEEEPMDWWSRYYISTGENPQEDKILSGFGSDIRIPRSSLPRTSLGGLLQRNMAETDTAGFEVYPTELENVLEFGGFQEWLHSFQLTNGKKCTRNRKQEKCMAVLKGCFRIYQNPLPRQAMDPLLPLGDNSNGLFGGIPNNKPVKVLVRAYIVKAINLESAKSTKTRDPYIVLQFGKHRLNDKENYIPKQLNPVFGKCFEFVVNFPAENLLHVQLYDWNLGVDKLIGETTIDMENRFYSRHRATCGLARYYETEGPNAWRDALKPSEILDAMCINCQMDRPDIDGRKIRIGRRIFEFQEEFGDDQENMALTLLHRWKDISQAKYSIVPEHVETRNLHDPKKTLKPQGQLLMWLDLFAEGTVPPAMPRDISMREPKSYELRVIIWNTDEVILSDDAFFTGEKMSDIYVKGWLIGKQDSQLTDVHYRSLTGEGNFNWRFVFPFDYLSIERKIVVKRKVSVFSWDETEFKMPPVLVLQVWDADHFSSDDHLGSISLNLNRFPRGAYKASLCTLKMLQKDGTVPQMSIFKQTRVRGWWPVCATNENGEIELTGKIEAEIQLLTQEEAEINPAGRGRKGPSALEKPKRPETSFINILHPFKTLRYAVWKNYKFTIIKIVIIIAIALIFILFFYAAPGYMAKKILRA